MRDSQKIIQPNHVSTAKFTLTAIEKNVIYTIVDELQKIMSRDINEVFKEQVVEIEMRMIEKNNNYSRIRNAVKSLGSKHIEYELVIPKNGKVVRTSTSIVSGISYVKNSKKISFKVPSDACHFFCYIGGGFTSIQKTIAISLNSIYSKMLYELCCRWSDRGGFSTSIEKFKEYLGVSNKYGQIGHLRKKVLEVSQVELKLKADLFFNYSLIKEGRKYVRIVIKIHNNSKVNEEFKGVRQDLYSACYFFLSRYFPVSLNNEAQVYTDLLISKGKIEIAKRRFDRLDDDYSSGRKTKNDIKNLLLSRVLPDFDIKPRSKNINNTQLRLSVNK